ncbi:hypothetical protein M8J76_013330 [Diaphorina citri]|nr:hypothetical protein M8J76_013330 [Diaphorina citri]
MECLKEPPSPPTRSEELPHPSLGAPSPLEPRSLGLDDKWIKGKQSGETEAYVKRGRWKDSASLYRGIEGSKGGGTLEQGIELWSKGWNSGARDGTLEQGIELWSKGWNSGARDGTLEQRMELWNKAGTGKRRPGWKAGLDGLG